MTDKGNSKTMNSGAGAQCPVKPVPMKLFATWEVDRTPSDCIPRLCSLTLTRLVVLRPLGNDLATISIAVKMQSSKRTLRSNELILPSNGLLDQTLELTFSLQYPHFLKRDGNKLHVLLQRRKRYKNRTILGFKTLAEGVIRMDQVLQKQMDIELELNADNKDNKGGAGPLAKINVLGVSSTPVDGEHKPDRDRECSDEEDEFSSGEEEAGDLSDSEHMRNKLPHARHNLKQRFVSLLRRFRVADTEGGRGAALPNRSDIQALFQELESLSCDEDSGEPDTISISSTPKPSLRPFFSSSRSLLDSNAQPEEERNYSGSDGNADLCGTDHEAQSDPQTGSPPREKHVSRMKSDTEAAIPEEKKNKLFRTSVSAGKKKHSLSIASENPSQFASYTPESIPARKSFIDQVSRLLPIEETILPDQILLLFGPEQQVCSLQTRLNLPRTFLPLSASEVKVVMSSLIQKIQKYCNSFAKPSIPIKIILVGNDALIGWFLRSYVELLSAKPPDWLTFMKVYVVPLGMSSVCKQLAQLDSNYCSLFPPDHDLKEELAPRIVRYVTGNGPTTQLPLAEAMLTLQDDSSQLFVPFVSEVRVGPSETANSLSVDLEEMGGTQIAAAPALTPPSSPNVQAREGPWEPMELQLDYWQLPVIKPGEKSDKTTKADGKTSIRGMLRGLQANPGINLSIQLANKEKKQKIMRLGKKKDKESTEAKAHSVDGISRLICSAKGSNSAPMRLIIDGSEWSGVKFFQLSSTWQTHVKYLSVALIGVPLAISEP